MTEAAVADTAGSCGILQLQGLRFAYDGPPVLDGIDLQIGAGELVGILGPNGAGKTTLLRLATGSLEPTTGSVALSGRPLSALTRRERARQVAVVPQEARVVFDFTVREIVPGVLTDDLLTKLRARKAEIAAALAPHACADCGDPCGSAERCAVCAAVRVVEWVERRGQES